MARSRTKISGAMITDASITSADLGASVARGGDVDFMALKVGIQNNLTIYNLKDGIVDRYADATGVDASASTNEIRDSSGKYYGSAVEGSATGGTITTYTGYKVHTFLVAQTGTNFVTPSSADLDILIVAGGGGGAGSVLSNTRAGGGGAGGMRVFAASTQAGGTYAVTVGAGAAGGGGGAGGNSGIAFSTALNASGGGNGGSGNAGNTGLLNGIPGGSGGGGGNNGPSTQPTIATGNSGGYSPSEGNSGGSSTANVGAGGGGSHGSVGAAASGDTGGTGGAGTTNDYQTGVNQTYAGGGGGGGKNNGGPGGSGGGGAGAGGNGNGTAATDNTGSGGGGSASSGPSTDGGDGGDGIVVIRYASDAFSSYNNMTLVSNAQTAQAAPTLGRIMVLDEASTGTTTINSDVKAYISRDNGTTYSQATLTDDGEYATGKRMLSGSVDISGQPSGTAMRYKIETLNQSSTKVTRIYGTALMW